MGSFMVNNVSTMAIAIIDNSTVHGAIIEHTEHTHHQMYIYMHLYSIAKQTPDIEFYIHF